MVRPVALRPRQSQRRRGFSSLTVRSRAAKEGRLLIRVSFTRDSARFAVRSPDFLEGAILDRRAGGPNAAQPELDRQQVLHTALSPDWQGKALQAGHTSRRKPGSAQLPLTEPPPN